MVRLDIYEIGHPTGLAIPEIGMRVRKSGRTTDLTIGEIEGVDATVKVSYGAGKTATFRDQLLIGPPGFSGGGDSGSVIVVDGTAESGVALVGLLFAGSEEVTIANHMAVVFRLLGIGGMP